MQQAIKEISINRDSLLKDIQQAFSDFYPFLKIEFLSNTNATTIRNSRIQPDILKQIQYAGEFAINAGNDRTVAELCYDFQNLAGVIIHILRKSGNVWTVITLTDDWTLERQNAEGKFISLAMAGPSP